jgi:hypothetical protein
VKISSAWKDQFPNESKDTKKPDLNTQSANLAKVLLFHRYQLQKPINMTTKACIFFLFALALGLGSCKEEIKTPAETMSDQIKAKAGKISRANVYERTNDSNGYTTVYNDVNYKLQGQFVVFTFDLGTQAVYYNMDRLAAYAIDEKLNLYFD